MNSCAYTHDLVGNRTSMTDMAGTHNYAYDVIYRLLQATHPVPPTEQFTYDQAGNRLTDTSGNSYFYNNANRLLNYNGVTFTYDANGNIISRGDSCGTTTYTWDSENRLTGVNGFKPDCSTLVASYKYDPFGRRIEKNVNGTVTKYLYSDEDIIAEYDGNNQLVAHYIHDPRIDEPIAMVKNSQGYFYHFDGLGSVTGITDSTGNVVQRYNYDSFGNITYMLDPNFIQPYTYTSREYDPESGLYFYRARYYDAKIGRFISKDPIGLEGGINLYAYVGNNPLNSTDPSGLFEYKQGVPRATGRLLELLQCIEKYYGSFVVTATTNDHPPASPHGRGEAADIRYPSNPGKLLCSASKCGAGCGIDELKHPSAHSTGPHIHVQLGHCLGGSRRDLPAKDCCTK